MNIKADLHIHSCLSPCGSLEMSPSAIAERASKTGLHAAALTDHNSALNCRAFEDACKNYSILPIFGLEVTSLEEAHILCLFDSVKQAEELGVLVYNKLPNIPNNPEKSGDQVWVDSAENIIGEAEKYLITAADVSLDQLFDIVMQLDGMFIPAHIDRPVFSIPSQLGFLPEMNYSALEITSRPCPIKTGTNRLIMNSDAHYIDDIARRFSFYDVEDLSFQSIKKAVYNNNIYFN